MGFKRSRMKTTAVKGRPGIRQKENGKFIVFKSIAGKRITKEFTDLREAYKWKEDKSNFDLSVNGKNPTLSGQGEGRNEIYFRDVYEQYLKEGMIGLTEYTVYKKKQRMGHFLTGLHQVKMSEMCGRVILKHLEDLKLLVSPESKRCNFDKELKDLASIFAWYDREITPFPNPVKRKQFDHGVIRKIRKKKKDLPLDMVDHALNFMEEPFKSLATIQFLLGLRVGEAAALNTHTVNFKANKIDISESIVWLKGKPKHEFSTKTDVELEKDITPMVRKILLKMNENRPKNCIFFFHHNGKPLRYGMILNKFNEAMKAAGLESYSGTHLLRHSFATHARKEGGLDVAQAGLGHTTARQTEKYARLDANEKVTGVVLEMEKFLQRVQPSCNQSEQSVI